MIPTSRCISRSALGLVFLFLGSSCAQTQVQTGERSSLQGNADSEKTKSFLGKTVELSGEAWIIHGKGADAKVTLQKGGVSTLSEGDHLVTGPQSEVKLVLGNSEAALLLKKNSEIRISQNSNKIWNIYLSHGALLSYVKPQVEGKKTYFKVSTQTATVGVRGTEFFVKVDAKKGIFLCTCNGIVSIDDKVLILGKNHNTARWIAHGKKPLTKRLKSVDQGSEHSDREIQALTQLL